MDSQDNYDMSNFLSGVPDNVLLQELLRRPRLLQKYRPNLQLEGQGDQHQFPLPSSRSTSSASNRLSNGSSFRSFPSTDTSSIRSSTHPSLFAHQISAFDSDSGSYRQSSSFEDTRIVPQAVHRNVSGKTQHLITSANPPTPRSSEESPVEKRPTRFFCTYCHETGITKTFKTKSDWKRHEQNFHETGEEWHCQTLDCPEVFTRAADYIKHFQDAHHDQPYPDNAKVTKPNKNAFGCGFENCKVVIGTWKDRCDHVAKCMESGKEWTYSTRMRNLLKQEQVSDIWKTLRDSWCHQFQIRPCDLRWDPSTSRSHIQRLEYGYFRPNPHELLQTIIKLGVQRFHGRSSETSASHSQPAIVSNPQQPTYYFDSFSNSLPGNLDPVSQFYMATPEGSNTTTGKRFSVMMSDAPPLGDFNPRDFTNVNQPDMSVLPSQEMGMLETFSVNTTPPLADEQFEFLDNSYHEESQRASKCKSLKKSVRRVKSGLSTKKSQQFQQPIDVDHPDLPPRYHLPGSGSKIPASANHPTDDTSRNSNHSWFAE